MRAKLLDLFGQKRLGGIAEEPEEFPMPDPNARPLFEMPETTIFGRGPASAPASAPASMPADAPAPASAEAATPTSLPPDALLSQYNDRIAQLDRERQDMLTKAEGERQYSDQEKIAMALIAALPGLLGAGIGGAVAGGAGAAAGAAGGLTGSATGLTDMQKSKDSRRLEAKADANKLRDIGDAVKAAANKRAEDIEAMGRDDKKTKEAREFEQGQGQAKFGQQVVLQQLSDKADLQRSREERASIERAAALSQGQRPNKTTAEQARSAELAKRMRTAEPVFGILEEKGFNRSDLGTSARGALPENMRSEEFKSWSSAENMWLSGPLRKDSGGAITPAENENYGSIFFPRVGDSKRVQAMKAEFRNQVTAAMEASARGDIAPLDMDVAAAHARKVLSEVTESDAPKKSDGADPFAGKPILKRATEAK